MSDFLWVEKYRPKKISECILSDDLKNTFSEFSRYLKNSQYFQNFPKYWEKSLFFFVTVIPDLRKNVPWSLITESFNRTRLAPVLSVIIARNA